MSQKWEVIKRTHEGRACVWKAGDWLVSLSMVDGLSMYAGYFKDEKEARFYTDDPADVNERMKG